MRAVLCGVLTLSSVAFASPTLSQTPRKGKVPFAKMNFGGYVVNRGLTMSLLDVVTIPM
jgi:hypothetical protein